MAVQDEKAKDTEGTTFQSKFAQWLSPFQISFVIFWVICNYDFLLILIGKKAIVHDIYAHFGYGCGVVDFTDNNTISNTFKLNIFVCVEKSRGYYALYFAMWKVFIPLGLTLGYMLIYYPKLVIPLNQKYEDAGNDLLKKMVEVEVAKKVSEEMEMMEREMDRGIERMKANPQNP